MKNALFTSILAGSLMSVWLAPAQASTQAQASQQDFKAWVETFKQKALDQGISNRTLERAFRDVTLNQEVLDSDKKQPEFTQTFFQYFNRAVSPYRIEKGRFNYEKHQSLLDQVTRKYGVPGRFLVAFWGLETNYGNYTGNIPIIQSLATLAYDPRRSEFFSNELMSALTILDRGHVELSQMKGSWAGAMGQCQFMPSNYLRYAVDGDGDGKIDLWNSLPDVMHSAGHFLQQLGWQEQENWGREVQLPKGFNYALADNQTRRSLAQWRSLGITLADGRPIPDVDMQARLLLAADFRGPAFLVYDNYQVIKRWNNADKYALAVGHLADRIVGRPALSKQAPKNDRGLSRSQIKQIQTHLNLLGYEAGKPDGIAGSNTRKALRAFQKSQGVPADGYASLNMLRLLQKKHDRQVEINRDSERLDSFTWFGMPLCNTFSPRHSIANRNQPPIHMTCIKVPFANPVVTCFGSFKPN